MADMQIDGPTFTNLGQGLTQKVGFFFIVESVLRAGLLD